MPNNTIESRPDSTLTVLGLGPMGRAFAAAAVAAGRSTVIWNRTPDKAHTLVAQGATLAPTAADAVRQASLVICCVMNYDVLQAIVGDVADWSATTLVNLTSGHSDEARAMAVWAGEREIPYLEGAILTPAPTIGTPSASILYCGPEPVFTRSRTTLETFSPSGIYLGDDYGTAAAYEMALLDLFAMTIGGLAHSFAMATTEGITPTAFARFAKGIGNLLPDMIDGFAGQLLEGRFPGNTSSIASAGSAITHVAEASEARGMDTGPLHAVQAIIDRAITAGHGHDGYPRLAQILTPAGASSRARS
ncbi:3-hydroxyisobutyrate dehydrogenase-like beta-hydroxyacid dehydrogenase [Actinoallomurus bryophytorum]|uniref:3-hydroxyisobutyrate dehydrogenase-like beta-hydroxyacid dehydrogenase n=1 Tax=Actinoallomurus bryophytorum TaxID=1490222 RepID=A0A543CMX0_9ACTN|nr:NAD(P)-binding domain-containing protein [Actinoallomurus bryophytorum]TQL98442.1 3-hydroxyisobutyrate dehydrogenase-like beta-hydroxyacid dehydrogenase [Actinoallomurus bryophytorum]